MRAPAVLLLSGVPISTKDAWVHGSMYAGLQGATCLRLAILCVCVCVCVCVRARMFKSYMSHSLLTPVHSYERDRVRMHECARLQASIQMQFFQASIHQHMNWPVNG
jgi:hypothetical protein